MSRRLSPHGDLLKDLGVVVLLVSTAFIFMTRAMLPPSGKILYGYDVYQLFHPFADFMFDAFRRGELPLWNPNFFLGFPQYAEPQLSTFYPLTWPLAWLPETVAFPFQYAIHFAWAGIGGYVLIRRLGGGRAGALLAAFSFAYMITMTSRINVGHLPHMMTFAWVPWCLAAAHWAAKKGTWAATVVAGIPLGMAFLIGYIPFLILIVPLMVIFMVWLALLTWKQGDKRGAGRILLQLAGLGLMAALLASVQLLPSLEFTRYSNRLTGQYEGVDYPIGIPFLLTSLMPDLFGAPFGTSDVAMWLDLPGFIYWEWAVYVGILPFILFLLTWSVGRKAWRFWVIFGLAGLLLAMGDQGVFYRFMFDFVPGTSWFRFISRPVYYFNLAVAILAGLMFDRYFDMPADRHARLASGLKKVLFVGAPLTILLLLLSLALQSFVDTGQQVLVQQELVQPELVQQESGLPTATAAIGSISAQLLRLLLLGTASLALLIWGYGRSKGWIAALALLIIVVDLWTAGQKFITFIDNEPDWGWQQANLYLPPNRDDYRVLQHALSENTGYFYGFQSIYGYDGFTLQTSEEMRDLAVTDSRIVRLLSGQYYIHGSWWEDHILTPGWEPLDGPQEVAIYQREDALPRAFIVHEVIGAANEEESLALIKDQGIDFTRVAVVQVAPNTNCDLDPGSGSADQVAITNYEGNQITIQADAATTGWLVLNDLYYPGWEATVDGQPAVVQPTNYALRGICLPAGQHEVLFSFRPEVLSWGALLTGAALIILLLALLTLWRKRAKQESRPTSLGPTRGEK
jgi:hypothetical protein